MARIGNETKLVLKLAAEKARRQPALQGVEPHGFPDDPRLHEAYVMGFRAGQADYESTLKYIVVELEEAR